MGTRQGGVIVLPIMKTIVVGLLLALGAAACGSEPTGGGAGGRGTRDPAGTWILVEGVSPEGEIRIDPDFRISLRFEDDSVSGTSACNHYGGDVTIDGSSFAAGGLGGTDMGCAPEIMEAESRYLAALMGATTIEQGSDTLTLTGQNIELVFEREPPVPTAELENTEWHLEGLIEGRGPEGTVSEADPGTLTLHDDGTLSGHTGCRTLTGTWEPHGDEIFTPELGAEGGCSEQQRLQDGHVVNVIGDGFTVEIEGATLTIYSSRGDQGLIYKAPDE